MIKAQNDEEIFCNTEVFAALNMPSDWHQWLSEGIDGP